MSQVSKKFEYTWEQAIEILRADPQHQQLIYDSYLTSDLKENCERFSTSTEFTEVLRLIRSLSPPAQRVLDLPAGNGIASYAFAKAGFDVLAVEPDPSATVGRGAIESVKQQERLANIKTCDAYGEELPCDDEEFDVVFIRQGLHHAKDLAKMLSEASRVTKPEGLIIAAREPVVDDYEKGLQTFLDEQPDHQLYGGEHAFTHRDYIRAFKRNRISLIHDFGPYESIINLAPSSFGSVESMLLNSRKGKMLQTVLPAKIVANLGFMILRFRNTQQGRLHTFVGRKRTNGRLIQRSRSFLTL